MKFKPLTCLLLCIYCTSCSLLTSLGMNALSPNKGGINTELVVGDKEQVLGSNQDIKAGSVGKVVGNSDNSTAVNSANEVKITNNAIPVWLIGILLILASLVGWLAPRPELWKRMINRNKQ